MYPRPEWPEFLDFKTLARYASISEWKRRDLAKQSDFPVVRLGRLVRVPRAAFHAWMLARARPEHPSSASVLELIRPPAALARIDLGVSYNVCALQTVNSVSWRKARCAEPK